MRHIHIKGARTATALLLFVLAGVVLAACGSSSNGSSTTAKTSANASASSTTPTTGTGSTTSTTGTGTSAPRKGRFTAVRECLAKEGVKLPARKPGQRGGFLGGQGGLPAGVSRTKLEAALKKCGGFPRGAFPGAGRHFFDSPAVKQAYAKFASCMRENGVKLPAPNTSGKGPIFNTKGIDTTGATFKAADTKCRSALLGAFRARPGTAPGPGGPGGAPGSAAGAPGAG